MLKQRMPACKLPVLQMFLGINSADMAKEITHVGADRCNEGLIGNIGLDGIHDLHSFRINQNPPYGGLIYFYTLGCTCPTGGRPPAPAGSIFVFCCWFFIKNSSFSWRFPSI